MAWFLKFQVTKPTKDMEWHAKKKTKKVMLGTQRGNAGNADWNKKAETTCFKKMRVAKKTSRKLGELCFWWLSLTDSSWTCKFQGIFVAKQTYLVISNLPIGNSQTDEPTKTEKQFGTWKISAMVRYTKTPLTCKGCFFSKAWVAQKFKDWLYVFGPGPQIYSIYVYTCLEL